ncbi:hypothetical protein BU16DRAFT_565866 [Lophium mytilinum]|uniref:Uncharacterized protein n=1 Tax=Lophium mytilinum TaxID=390894 RepID=A0A6A6QHL1_9PEZI|nr:hypothetical protein BU16DRAFT_565866 [Lophium mytilinum]
MPAQSTNSASKANNSSKSANTTSGGAKSNHQLIKDGGWDNQKHFMESYGLRLDNPADCETAKEIQKGFREIDKAEKKASYHRQGLFEGGWGNFPGMAISFGDDVVVMMAFMAGCWDCWSFNLKGGITGCERSTRHMAFQRIAIAHDHLEQTLPLRVLCSCGCG